MVVALSRRSRRVVAAGNATSGRAALVSLGANLLTHGLLWTTFGWVPAPYVPKLLAFEAAVWLAEAWIYAAYGVLSWRDAVGVSLAANALTTAIGLWRMSLV